MQRREFLKTVTIGSSLLAGGCATGGLAGSGRTFFMYVGTYTGPKSEGIYVFRFDPRGGTIEPLGLAAAVKSPSFLAVHPSGRYLYCVNETDSWAGTTAGSVTAFRIDKESGKLAKLNESSSGGPGPCHLSVDRTGRCVLVANYGGGSVASLPIQADGSLSAAASFFQHKGSSVNPARQKEPHGHSINVSPDNRFAFAADLGLDQILAYRLDASSGRIEQHDPAFVRVAPGSGPRHFAFHPGGRHAYVINEMACTVIAFDYDAAKGLLKEIQTISTLPAGVPLKPEYSTAEVVAHPSGRFLYGSNRGHHSISVYSVAGDGKLRLTQNVNTQGRTPRNFAIDPTGQFLFAENQDTDTIVVFRVNSSSGALSPTGQTLNVGSPVCIRFATAS